MRVLITNNALAERAGSELYTCDVAAALLERGHQPIVYSQVLGEVAEELRAATVPVVEDLHRIAEPPHVIHGHHHLETMTALHHFPGVRAVFFCHGWMPWQEAPPVHPRIARYVAVDELCRQRLVHEGGIPPELTEVLLNFVDLDRFRRRPPLPRSPRRALFFSNHAVSSPVADEVRHACGAAGIELDVVGLSTGNPSATPETLLPAYDLVFAKARAALESMAVGCAVITCDAEGAGPLVDTRNFDALRALNFGLRTLSAPARSETIAAEVARYDRAEAAAVCTRVRREAGRSEAVERMLELYRIAAKPAMASGSDEGRATADYLRTLAPRIKQNDSLHHRLAEALGEADRWRERAESGHGEAELQRGLAATRVAELESEVEQRRGEASALENELGRVYGTITWRLRARVLGTRAGRGLRRMISWFR